MVEILDPTLRSPTAEDIGRRVKARLGDTQKPKTWVETHGGTLGAQAEDLRTRPGMEFTADIISKGALLMLLGRLSLEDRHPENLSLCRLASQFTEALPSEEVSRPDLLRFLGEVQVTGLTNNSGYRALSALSQRASTGL